MYDTDGFDNLDTPQPGYGMGMARKPKFTVSVQLVDSNGYGLYYAGHTIVIHRFPGVISIDDLQPVKPLPREGQLREDLKRRGRLFAELQGQQYLEYRGFMLEVLGGSKTPQQPSYHPPGEGPIGPPPNTVTHSFEVCPGTCSRWRIS
jgi:hypothetical protein